MWDSAWFIRATFAQAESRLFRGMGRPPLKVVNMNLNVDPDDMQLVAAITGPKGVSKFTRDAIRAQLDHVAPDEAKAGPPYFEGNGGHEPRLTLSGRAAVFAILRKKKATLDDMQRAFGFADPIEFIHALLGHRSLPNQAAMVVVTELLGRLYQGE
jgi:hypothetical protein